ncbi:hypothetical protein [Alicyclobacillus fastidiosus]|nr:hypothetical protein [Alicyclobacillus fastidiosus]GMA60267.1 hypothetical protein GCM10025859_07070 [Alicyclobacillus fastidiosus]
MAIGLPMVLFKPIPGQEEINADYAVRAGVAVRAQHAEEAQAFLQKIMHQPHILQDMRRAAERVPVLGAAENIASRLIDLAGGTVTSPLQAFPSELQMT